MSDRSSSASEWISSLWQDTWPAIHSGGQVQLTARWIFPVCGPPIEHGVLEIADGRIAGLQPLAGRSCPTAVDLGPCAILPALVNAHAHLEFSDRTSPVQPAAPFAGWIENLMTWRRGRTESTSVLAARGAEQSARCGTSIVGDIVTGDWVPSDAVPTGSRLLAFRELIGLQPEQYSTQMELARSHLAACRAAGVLPALSPHAPFSVAPELFQSLVQLATDEQVPLCLHLAETQAELDLLKNGSGELMDMLTRFGLWRDDLIPRGLCPLDYLYPLADLPAASIAHGNYLSDQEIQFLADHRNITTVYCPRTHHFFGHAEHPWQQLIEAGAVVALGTDGRSSNPDYSLWSEVQYLDRLTHGTARPTLLEMATQSGATALGLPSLGSLKTGSVLEPALIRLGDSSSPDPWQQLFDPHSRPEPVPRRL